MKFLSLAIGFTSSFVLAIAPTVLAQETGATLPYSTSLSISSNYNGPACIQLGQWDGGATIMLEANNFHTGIQLTKSSSQVTKALNINVNQNLGGRITLYSDRYLSPTLNQGQCKIKSGVLQVHSLNWFR